MNRRSFLKLAGLVAGGALLKTVPVPGEQRSALVPTEPSTLIPLSSYGVIRDDTAYLQGLIDCAPNNSFLFIPPRTYYVNQPLCIERKENFVLYGNGSKIFTQSDTCISFWATQSCSVFGMHFDGSPRRALARGGF